MARSERIKMQILPAILKKHPTWRKVQTSYAIMCPRLDDFRTACIEITQLAA